MGTPTTKTTTTTTMGARATTTTTTTSKTVTLSLPSSCGKRLGRKLNRPPQDQGGGEKTARRLPPPCCSSRPGLELRAKLREATPAEPLVTECGGDPRGYVSIWTRENPSARCCHARGVAAHPVTQAVPLTARAGCKARLAHWKCIDGGGNDG